MSTTAKPLDVVDQMITAAVERGLVHCVAEDESFNGRTIRVAGREMIHFGSCSYLGLELDPRLKRGATDATNRFGALFACSRAYLSAGPYRALEELLERIFEGPVVAAPTTTLAHLAALPVLCDSDDALLLDQQAHHSLHMAAQQVRAQGARVELLRHGRIDLLEERIDELRRHFRRIWYAGDGVYSMYGNLAPVDRLVALANRWEQLHLYLDDAHGISWRGARGQGYVLDAIPSHERMVVATTLAKSFGAGGGAVLAFPNAEWRRRVKTCGGPMIFAGPIAPPILGSAIASARIHLSQEIEELQRQLRQRIVFANELLIARGLPLVSPSEVPVRFVGASLPSVAQTVAARLMDRGFFANVAHFPAVPMKRAGIRFTLTLHQSFDDIRELVEAFAEELPRALEEEGSSLAEVRAAFRLPPPEAGGAGDEPETRRPAPAVAVVRGTTPAPLTLQHQRTIRGIPSELWDRCLGARGSFTWGGLSFLESAFSENPDAENNWNFHYYVIREGNGQPALATFFCEATWKDDMLASQAVSTLAEQRRRKDPRFLTSRVLSMGCLLTEGNHLFLDRGRDWRAALRLLLQHVDRQAESCGATTVVLRDLPAGDAELGELLCGRGFVKLPMPESMVLKVDWEDDEEFLSRLSPKARRHQRHEVLPRESAYDVEVLTRDGRIPGSEELAHFHRLYQAVKHRNLSLNTFDLPKTLFQRMLVHPEWELVLLRLRSEFGGEPGALPVAVGACFVGPEQYVPMVIGLDYRYVHSHGLYRQCLLQTLRRARHHGLRRILLGMGAPLEKRRFGAKPHPSCLFLRTEDPFHLDLLAALTAEAGG